jgi:hypothetical protein
LAEEKIPQPELPNGYHFHVLTATFEFSNFAMPRLEASVQNKNTNYSRCNFLFLVNRATHALYALFPITSKRATAYESSAVD